MGRGSADRARIVIRHLLRQGYLTHHAKDGLQTKLANHFGVSRQRIGQLVNEQRALIAAAHQRSQPIDGATSPSGLID